MKRYKLIKTYPGNQVLGAEFEEYQDKNPYYVNYPEFWEEIIEPNCLITAFRNTKHEILKIGKDGSFYYETLGTTVPGLWLETCLKAKHNEIYSVKNKDGVEFTIGNSVKVLSVRREIIKFQLLFGVLYCHTKDYVIEINSLKKPKTPIFISADGKEMFIGDSYYVPQVNGMTHTLVGTILRFNATLGIVASEYKFSTLELAQEYVDNNKPKVPIFTSADNHEYFSETEDVSLFSVLPKANWQEDRYRLKELVNFPKKEWLHFHTKEARQEYIDSNKPKYSIKDIKDVYYKVMIYPKNDGLEELIEELKYLSK